MYPSSSFRRPGAIQNETIKFQLNGSPLSQEPSPKGGPSGARARAENKNTPECSATRDFAYENIEYNLVVVTYQNESVLVQLTPTYKEVIDIVLKEFPSLCQVPRDDISIGYQCTYDGRRAFWRIADNAWATAAKALPPKTHLEIGVRGEEKYAGPLQNPRDPPPYWFPNDESGDERRSLSPQPRAYKGRPGQQVTKKRSGNSISSFFKFK